MTARQPCRSAPPSRRSCRRRAPACRQPGVDRPVTQRGVGVLDLGLEQVRAGADAGAHARHPSPKWFCSSVVLASGASSGARCPTSGSTSNREPEVRPTSSRFCSAVVTMSSAPCVDCGEHRRSEFCGGRRLGRRGTATVPRQVPTDHPEAGQALRHGRPQPFDPGAERWAEHHDRVVGRSGERGDGDVGSCRVGRCQVRASSRSRTGARPAA